MRNFTWDQYIKYSHTMRNQCKFLLLQLLLFQALHHASWYKHFAPMHIIHIYSVMLSDGNSCKIYIFERYITSELIFFIFILKKSYSYTCKSYYLLLFVLSCRLMKSVRFWRFRTVPIRLHHTVFTKQYIKLTRTVHEFF